MKKVCIAAIILSLIFSACARAISPYEAAHGRAKCGRYIGR